MSAPPDLDQWVVDAIRHADGAATIVEIARYIWIHHETDLRAGGDLFYTWQYQMRWAANRLRRSGVLRAADQSPRGHWELTASAADA